MPLLPTPFFFDGLIIAEFALVMVLSARIMKMSFPVAGLLFAAYSIVNGVTLSTIFLAYSMESIANAFFRNSRHLWRHVALWLVYQARPQHHRSFPLHDAHRVDYCHDCQYLPCQQRFRLGHHLYRCNRVQRPHCLRYAENESAAHRVSAYRRKQFAEDCSSLQPFALS